MSTDLKFSLITTLLIVLGVIVAGGLTAALR
ncbi:YnhF family membrane protein [Salmonella enterica subsp. enterica]|nr:YnhF family membrane protein [Salmonella enterica subsp. enterica]